VLLSQPLVLSKLRIERDIHGRTHFLKQDFLL
jgi:hypothetical protein